MIVSLVSPFEGSRSDRGMYIESGLETKLCSLYVEHTGVPPWNGPQKYFLIGNPALKWSRRMMFYYSDGPDYIQAGGNPNP